MAFPLFWYFVWTFWSISHQMLYNAIFLIPRFDIHSRKMCSVIIFEFLHEMRAHARTHKVRYFRTKTTVISIKSRFLCHWNTFLTHIHAQSYKAIKRIENLWSVHWLLIVPAECFCIVWNVRPNVYGASFRTLCRKRHSLFSLAMCVCVSIYTHRFSSLSGKPDGYKLQCNALSGSDQHKVKM